MSLFAFSCLLCLPGKQGVNETDSSRGITFGQRAVPSNGSAQVWKLGMDVHSVRGTWARDLSEAKAAIESVKILLSPAASLPSHTRQQPYIALSHLNPLQSRQVCRAFGLRHLGGHDAVGTRALLSALDMLRCTTAWVAWMAQGPGQLPRDAAQQPDVTAFEPGTFTNPPHAHETPLNSVGA